MSCCNYQPYDNVFDLQRAQRELIDYSNNGLKASSQSFMNALDGLPVKNKSLLDIGGGVGALTFELIRRNISHATQVDLSQASTDVFQTEVNRRLLTDKVRGLRGDFLDLENQLSSADLVTLDKVICCYADYEILVNKSAEKAKCWYVYSIPRNHWLVKAYFLIEGVWNRMRGKYLKVHFHPNEEIKAIIRKKGFNKKHEVIDGKWQITVFERSV